MIYDLTKRFVFIHIPRTAGTAIIEALAQRCPDAVVDVFELKHANAMAIRERIGRDEWDHCYRFSVIRSPWDIIASDYRHTVRQAKAIDSQTALYCTPGWMERMRRVLAYGSFAEFVRREYLGRFRRGFWERFCLGPRGKDLGVEPVLFDELAESWPAACDRIGIDQFELPRVNGAGPGVELWTVELWDAVGELCCWGVERR